MRRGKVRWYTFRAPDKRRPVVILTRDSAIGYLTSLTPVRMQEVDKAICFGIDDFHLYSSRP